MVQFIQSIAFFLSASASRRYSMEAVQSLQLPRLNLNPSNLDTSLGVGTSTVLRRNYVALEWLKQWLVAKSEWHTILNTYLGTTYSYLPKPKLFSLLPP